MALNPALRAIVAATGVKHRADKEAARELLLNLIGNELERIHATPHTLFDPLDEAIVMLDQIERWCIGRVDAGLIFRDPADDVVTLEP